MSNRRSNLSEPQNQFSAISLLFLALVSCLILPAAAQAQYTEGILYTFCAVPDGDECLDGDNPTGPLILDSQGNLYGTTKYGGDGTGNVFEFSPQSGAGDPWAESTLFAFCATAKCVSDGQWPSSGVIFDSQGNLYGTTSTGNYGGGFIFMLSPPSGGLGAWNETILYEFTSRDGGSGLGSLIFDSQGNLYGTAFGMNAGNAATGQVFELKPPSSGSGPWTETTLYAFTGGSDGGGPNSGLIFDSHGNLYGTTAQGGDLPGCRDGAAEIGCGVVFELSPPCGGTGPWTETVLYTFTGATDGAVPNGELVFDAAGNLYGAADMGGDPSCLSGQGCGVVYELSPPSASNFQ